MQNKTVIALSGICKVYKTEDKVFGNVLENTALHDVNIKFFTSEVHALLGENGAGKSTLVNILAGFIQPTDGKICIADTVYAFASPKDALQAGIAIVQQKPLLAENATVFENIMLRRIKKSFFDNLNINTIAEKQKIEIIKKDWNLDLDLGVRIKNLSVEKKFYVAMLSALYSNPSFLILDEPASAFSGKSHYDFFSLIKHECKRKDIGLILITHKVKEATAFADRISVLKGGKLFDSFLTAELIKNNNAENFLKEKIFSNKNSSCNLQNDETVALEKKAPMQKSDSSDDSEFVLNKTQSFELHLKDIKNSPDKVDIVASAGKITGAICFQNSGLEYLEDLISGMICEPKLDAQNNFILINEGDKTVRLPINKLTPSVLLKNKIGIIPSDRNYRASNPMLTIEEVLSCYTVKTFFIKKSLVKKFSNDVLLLNNIAVDNRELCSSLVSTLSGGQLQRIILSRCLAGNSKIIIAIEPAWGLDIGSTESLMSKFRCLANAGSIVFILAREVNAEVYKDFFDKIYFLGSEN